MPILAPDSQQPTSVTQNYTIAQRDREAAAYLTRTEGVKAATH